MPHWHASVTVKGMRVVRQARHTDKLAHLAAAINAHMEPCDVANANSIASLFHAMDRFIGKPDLLIFNLTARAGH